MKEQIKIVGNVGTYIEDGNVISFQMGDRPMSSVLDPDPLFPSFEGGMPDYRWQTVQGFQVVTRGYNDRKCEEIASDIKKNRLLPRLITKQVNMLYGHGPAVYVNKLEGGKLKREWIECPEVMGWLDSWSAHGIETDYKEFAKSIIKNFYYFHDFFVKWRFSMGKERGAMAVAGLESVENRLCRLATQKRDAATDVVYYKDFRHIAVGKWDNGISTFKIYPKFSVENIQDYRFAAISHHREKSVDDFYGVNETHEGTRSYIRGSNETADYINSFLKNALAAKIHIVIPNAWIESKRNQITRLCDENKKRASKGESKLKYNGIDIGTSFKESVLIQYIQQELRNISQYLSGADNQGKAYATYSFKNSSGEEERWKIETVDLKYKEYVDALISYDKRADEVLLSSVGLDSSISSVSKDGVISKSGADAYYNYLIYILSLTSEDEICSEPFNLALAVNFPDLYAQGMRIGYYREVPSRQEDVSPKDRLNNQQS
jgi:hypothetical protein